MPIVQFTPFSSLVQPAFWHELTSIKIDVLRLSDEALPVSGSYSIGRSIHDRETGNEDCLGMQSQRWSRGFRQECSVSYFWAQPIAIDAYQGHLLAHSSPRGHFKNYNTIEEFKAADKSVLFNQEAEKIWESIIATRDTSSLTNFLLITFADLKKYKYYYWFAFPAFVAKPAWEIDEPGWKPASDELSHESLSTIHAQLRATPLPFFLVRSGVEIAPVESYATFFANVPPAEQTIGFVDPSASPTSPGWPLRNLLAYLHALYPATTSSLRILCWRDTEVPSNASWKSRFGVVHAAPPAGEPQAKPSAVGWEKTPQGKLAPRVADLAPMMDPTRLADQAVDLNLKLMRWRILPALDLEKISSTRCLLLGAGTLGCYVARTLMGWGVRDITLVDSGRVSFSNPVRQPLFEFEDCLEGGKPKAECAAARMKKIFPGIVRNLMPQGIPSRSRCRGIPCPRRLSNRHGRRCGVSEELIDAHDAVFLLMDSRESRWLPTVMCAAKGKIVLNAALGFDTFLVMRHGVRASKVRPDAAQLGCYYCNDIVAPADSLTDRTLDEMCTVTRPGLAPIAASTAVELLASVLQHPDGVHAPAPPPNSDPSQLVGAGVLGLVPHQLRGFLAQFRNLHIVGAAYGRCTGCSEAVLKAYETQGFDMILQALNDDKYLPRLTGLDQLYAEGQKALEEVDWDVDDGEGGEDDF
ncbi:Autophagy-related protein [Mycena sanguinolenta]|uniref:Ubiquitin-like modifier-activating enzyme ATG7 n=1 Tax=Mycena sanguinolenta TaxID=230812 RepID=A0A8H7CUX9_9AGAR|nr:Autophagy-related protein [Mycena sanguinolenta]